MRIVAVYEAKTQLSELLAAVEQGEQVTITRRGQAIARLISATPAKRGSIGQKQKVAITIAALRKQRKGVTLAGDLGELIAEGRD
jgi:prevent-host-death family protein